LISKISYSKYILTVIGRLIWKRVVRVMDYIMWKFFLHL